MKQLAAELRAIYDELTQFEERWQNSGVDAAIEKVIESAKKIGEASSRSWIGYQARVYYDGFKTPPAGAHFSKEWGLHGPWDESPMTNWKEQPVGKVEAVIMHRAGGTKP